MNLTGIKFKIGTLDGEYPSGTSITDSVFEHMAKMGVGISSICYQSQQYPEGWTLTGRKLDFSSIITTANGTTVFVNLDQTLIIG